MLRPVPIISGLVVFREPLQESLEAAFAAVWVFTDVVDARLDERGMQFVACLGRAGVQRRFFRRRRPEEIGRQDHARTEISFRLPAGISSSDLPAAVGARARIDARAVSLNADDPVPVLRELTNWAIERGVGLPSLQVRRPTLEDVYLELTDQPDGTGEGPR